MTDTRRKLPSVNTLLETDEIRMLLSAHPRSAVVDAVRAQIDRARAGGELPDSPAAWAAAINTDLEVTARPTLRPVVNATGVILHTNLGRAPLAQEAIDAVANTAAGYSTLEYDVESGRRGSRHEHCVALLTELTGAEDAIVVNNCAAALVLALSALADGRDAIVSRGELIEIGGSFRIPEIMAESGATLVEVGTTNRTHVEDYIRACGERTGAIVKVHRSNFVVEGFVSEVSIDMLAPVAAERDVPVIYDLGSGLMVPLDDAGLVGEPLVSDGVAAGATLVLFSGDKLLGGPQAGIIVGRRAAIARLRAHPLARAMRVDKLTISALAATLLLYRDPANARRRVPVLAMLAQPAAEVEARAAGGRDSLRERGVQAEVVETIATVGGGSFPTSRIPSYALSIAGDAVALEAALRNGSPHVVGRISEGRLLLDLRTVSPREMDALVDAVVAAAE